jgi:hypothetical protein
MFACNTDFPARPAPRPHHRLVVPDAPETWTLEEVDFLLWPDDPYHQPGDNPEEEGWAELLDVS